MNKEWNNESENKPRVPAKDEARKIKFRGSYSGVDDELIMWPPDLSVEHQKVLLGDVMCTSPKRTSNNNCEMVPDSLDLI